MRILYYKKEYKNMQVGGATEVVLQNSSGSFVIK